MNSSDNIVELITFLDAITAGEACSHLEHAGIPFEVKDWATPVPGVDKLLDAPAVQLEIRVAKADLNECQTLLHNTMHLFPDPEIEEHRQGTKSKLDGEARVEVAACDVRADANAVRDALSAASISATIRELKDEDDPAPVSYSVEVNYEDTDRAFKAIERWSEQG